MVIEVLTPTYMYICKLLAILTALDLAILVLHVLACYPQSNYLGWMLFSQNIKVMSRPTRSCGE